MRRFSANSVFFGVVVAFPLLVRSSIADDSSLRGGQLFPGAKATYERGKELSSGDQEPVTIIGDKNQRVDGQHYQAIDKTYRIRIPHLSTGRITVADEVVAPRITNLVRFKDEKGWFAVIISTKVRADWPKDKDILDHCIKKSVAFLDEWPKEQSCLQRITGPLGKANQWIIKNATDPEFFPLLVGIKGKPDDLETIAISRTLVAGGYLYEFAMVLPVAKGTSAEKAVNLVQKQMDQLMGGWELSSK